MVKEMNVQEIAKSLEKKYGIKHYEILQRYMFERVLERITGSNFKDNFILKGGLLLSAMFGIDNRTTKDMDTTINGIDISKEKMAKVLNEILSIDLNDGVKFDLVDITNIREDDEYGGNKYHIIGKLKNLKVNFEIDISTGDKVTPKELKFKYPLIFEDRIILINSYNIETILTEKIETILKRGKFNSRMKDYYDVYYFLTKLRKDIDMKILKAAIDNTFTKRQSFKYLSDYEKIINSIIEDKKIKDLWLKYTIKNEYAKDIEIEDILNLLKDFLGELDLEIVLV